MTLPGGQPAPYVPGQGVSSSSAGPTDIWGLGEKATAPVFLGTVEGSFGGGRQAPFVAAANETPMRPLPASGRFGPQFKSALEAMQELPKLYAANKAGYIALQQKLYRAGFYGDVDPTSIGLGAYNQATIEAYRKAVLSSAQMHDAGTPVTFDELLAQTDPTIDARLKKVKPGFTAEYSNPDVVAAVAQQAAQAALGRNLSTAEVKQFTAEFHVAEQRWNADRRAAAEANAAGRDAQVESAPSAETEAARYVQQGSRGTEATGNRLADYVNSLASKLGVS